MGRERTDEERRRDEEEERRFWESSEDERIAEKERQEAAKTSAIETMEDWFHENFEDPQIQMPRDGEEQDFLYPYGGPFEAGIVLHEAFSDEFDAAWIVQAAERVEQIGTFEWAPTSDSEYYEHPDPQDETLPPQSSQVTEITIEILDRLNRLEAAVAAMPTTPANVGHNQPPDEIGLPPYTDQDASDVGAAIAETRTALQDPAPDPVELSRLSTRYEALRAKIGPWLAKKGDQAVDKFIEHSIPALTWGGIFTLFGDVSGLLKKLVQLLLGG